MFKRQIAIVKDLLSIANGKRLYVIQIFASCGMYHLASLLPPIATAGIIARVTEQDFAGIWYYVVLYAVFYFIYFSALHWNYYVYGVLGRYYFLEVQRKVFEHVTENDSISKEISRGKIVDTASEDVRYLVDVLDAAAEGIMGMLQLAVTFIIFCRYNVFVAIMALAIDVVYIVLMNDNSRRISRYYEGTRKYEDKITDTLSQILGNLRQTKTLNVMPNLDKNLDRTRARWQQDYKKRRTALTRRYCRMPYIVYGGKIVLYILLAYLVIQGRMTLDTLVLLISYFELMITCTDSALDYMLNLSYYGVRVKRVKHILDYAPSANIDFGDLENDYIDGLVVFDKVTYNIKRRTILDKVSFRARPNEITAIVGKAGSGKTTIMNLLYRLDRIKSGSILIDDESIYNYSRKVYSTNVSGVFQKPFVLEMSIRDNLALVDPDRQNQIAACKRVGIHDTIVNLPHGYNTVISAEDAALDDGQKQLLTIARALLSKAEILLFDEVTSVIDPAATTKVAQVLENLKQDHTIIVITHKSELMEIADRIIVLSEGKVADRGSDAALLKRSALYRELKNRTFAIPSPDREETAKDDD